MKATGAFIGGFLCVTTRGRPTRHHYRFESEEALALKETERGPVVLVTWDNNDLWKRAHLRGVTFLAT
jgi:hypothetical protein